MAGLSLSGCSAAVTGQGLPGEPVGSSTAAPPSTTAGPSGTSSASTSPTATPPTTTPTGTTPTTSSGPSFVPTDPNDPDAVLAFQAAALFVQRLDALDYGGAYDLLCPEVQAEVTVEEFSTNPPPPGTYTFTPLGQVGPGRYLGEFTFLGQSDEVIIRDDGSGQYCLAEPEE